MILAIVGTREFANPAGLRYARAIIADEIWNGGWDSFVTGDAPGADTICKDCCDLMARPCWVLAPKFRRWKPEGYEDRNKLIVASCDALLSIRDPGSKTYGSGWTADYAESIGKPVTRVEIR